MTEQRKPVWFITGCSTGFGRELARELLRRGKRVVVTARDKSKVEDLATDSANSLALTLDVTKPVEMRAAVQAAEQKFGAIDVLVNNAGYGYLAAIEEGEDAEIRAMFEVNVFGLADTIRVVLPGMRRAGRGHIVNITSVGGLVGNAASGYYAATKFAVEGLSEALAKEVAPLGIKVLAVEPGPFRTDWAGRSLKQTANIIEAYDAIGGHSAVANEILGSGDATNPGQDFQLSQSPVTYLANGAGYASTIALTVNGLPWAEVAKFYGQAPNATVFVTREDNQGATHVMFGDGVNGARLPTGVNNVVATYRIGAGAASPPAGKLTVSENRLQTMPKYRAIPRCNCFAFPHQA